MAICENATVKVIGGHYDGKTGKVISAFPPIDMAVVSFDDNGDVGKVSLSALVEIQVQKKPVESEIPEGAKKISRADFDNAVDALVAPEKVLFSGGNPMATIAKIGSVMALRDHVRNEIFKGNDAVVMTEGEFVAVLWSACNPGVAAKLIPGVKPGRKLNKIAVGAFVSFDEIIEILFGADNG